MPMPRLQSVYMQPINSRSTVKVICQSGTRHLFGFILRLLIHFVRMSDLSYFSWFFMNSLVPCLTRFNAAVNYLVIGLHFCSNSSAPVQSLLTHCLRKSMLFSNFSLFFFPLCVVTVAVVVFVVFFPLGGNNARHSFNVSRNRFYLKRLIHIHRYSYSAIDDTSILNTKSKTRSKTVIAFDTIRQSFVKLQSCER